MVKDYAKLYLMKSILYIFHHLMSLRTLRLSLMMIITLLWYAIVFLIIVIFIAVIFLLSSDSSG